MSALTFWDVSCSPSNISAAAVCAVTQNVHWLRCETIVAMMYFFKCYIALPDVKSGLTQKVTAYYKLLTGDKDKCQQADCGGCSGVPAGALSRRKAGP